MEPMHDLPSTNQQRHSLVAKIGPAALIKLVLVVLVGCGVRGAETDGGFGAALNRGTTPSVEWGVIIHGGAGTISRAALSAEREAMYRGSLEAALRTGHQVLLEGGDALGAVVAAVRLLEDDSLFNAGRGAVLTYDGRHELDAAVMDGATLRAGSVAGVTTVRNPILLARSVMEQSPHVFLIGAGAEAFAEEQRLEMVPNDYFTTESARQGLERARAGAATTRGAVVDLARSDLEGAAASVVIPSDLSPHAERIGTVGAVAIDRQGRIAAATSTGGMTNKRWGRVGDVPVIGAGTYANAVCGVSGTGWGEIFIRNTVARDICALTEMGGLSLQAAADKVIHEILPVQAENTGGVVAMGIGGAVAWSFNTSGMFRGRIDQDGRITIAIFGDN